MPKTLSSDRRHICAVRLARGARRRQGVFDDGSPHARGARAACWVAKLSTGTIVVTSR